MLNYHRERFGKLTLRALALCHSEPLLTCLIKLCFASSEWFDWLKSMLIIFEQLTWQFYNSSHHNENVAFSTSLVCFSDAKSNFVTLSGSLRRHWRVLLCNSRKIYYVCFNAVLRAYGKSGIRNPESGEINEWFKLGSMIDNNTRPPFSAFFARWMMIHERNE